MKKIIAIILLLAMALSLCACSNAKIRSEDAAINAVKKDRGTDTFICAKMHIGAMDSISYYTGSAEKTDDGWLVTLEGVVVGTLTNGSKGNKHFRFTCTISNDGTISDRNVEELYNYHYWK